MKKGIAVLVSVITVFASACTIFAYEPYFSSDENSAEIMHELEFGSFDNNGFNDGLSFNEADDIFVYEDGTEVLVSGEPLDASVYALCIHSMQSGYYQGHKSNGSGGCTVYVYNAQRCSKCGYIELGSLVSTHTYTVCPH